MSQPNIIFIPVDDLRPQLGCYGHLRMTTPHLDGLADEGTVFNRAYCQVPVCGASRASLLMGLRPTRGRFLDYLTCAVATHRSFSLRGSSSPICPLMPPSATGIATIPITTTTS